MVRFFLRNAALTSILWALAGTAWPQGQPARGAAAPHLPVCSTEKVNGDCVLNIDRNYPITLPTFQMNPKSHVSVYVFHPYVFEFLTLDAGAPTAFESSDQASALVAAAGPVGKGAVRSIEDLGALSATLVNPNFLTMAESMNSDIFNRQSRSPQDDLARRILNELTELNGLLTQAIEPLPDYFQETRRIYLLVREIESTQPRATGLDRQVPDAPDPWTNFADWRTYITNEILKQGTDTTAVLDRLPQPCQKSTDIPDDREPEEPAG